MSYCRYQLYVDAAIFLVGDMCDTMGERIGRIGRIDTDFFCHSIGNSKAAQRFLLYNKIYMIKNQ
jgi:hypothetical protein